METLARIHWLGKNRISAETNSAQLMTIWNMPESSRFQAQALDRLSLAPWRILRDVTNSASTNLLRSMLQDLVENESYIEVRRFAKSTNATEMVLAVRQDNEHALLWQTNLAEVLKSLTGIQVEIKDASHWSLKKHHNPNLIEFIQAGDWTLVGAAQDHNTLLDEVSGRIQRLHVPYSEPASNSWLQAELDLPAIATAFGRASDFTANLPRISLAATGESNAVRTTGQLVLPRLKLTQLNPWAIPTNLLQPTITSFTAVRGIAPLLESSHVWKDLNVGPPPDQLYSWSLAGLMMETYYAAPLPDASNAVAHVTGLVLKKSDQWGWTNDIVRFIKAYGYNGLEWRGFPYVAPFLQSTFAAGTNFAFAGFFQPDIEYPASPEVFKSIYAETNLVYYDWEKTGQRSEQLLFISQFLRMAAGRPQLTASSPGLLWIKALSPKLGQSTTTARKTNIPGQFTFSRKSSIGLTSVEMELLVTGLESFEAPVGTP